MENKNVCPHCGHEINGQWKFCPDCGNPIDQIIPEEQLKLFTLDKDGHGKEYRYGPEWVAMQLYMEGGYPTPEEAKQAWLRDHEERADKK